MKENVVLALFVIGIILGMAPWVGQIIWTPELTNAQVLRANWPVILLSAILIITGALMTQHPTAPKCPHCKKELNPVEFTQKRCETCRKDIKPT